MNYEQKYKEALERARQFSENPLLENSGNVVEYIFPELKESEDERIRKNIIEHFTNLQEQAKEQGYNCDYSKTIAWLEKQGEKPQGKTALEAINEEKVDNANKVEPKFNVGDWITNGEYTLCVESVKLLDYDLIDKDGRSVYDDISYVDSHFHLWTMRDAKDGNVLVDVYGNIGIIQEYDDFDWRSYCSLGCNGGFQGFNVEHENDKTHPATKEQRDILFTKMKESGYEWDEEKKELKLLITNGDDF